jgi:GT2 family glycosyltransferase
VERAEYYRRRLEWIIRTLTWWRIGLLAAALLSVILAATLGPAWLFAIIAWGVVALLFVLGGSRQASDHGTIGELRERLETIEREGVAIRGDLPPLPELGAEVGDLLRAAQRFAGPTPADHGHDHRFAESPVVSVIVPCFDDERFIADCLESVARQTFDDWECIVVDDASRDRSASIALGFARRDARFRVVTHARNGGLSAARNTGLRAARGPLVAFLDSDDMLLPNSLAHRVAAMAGQWANDDVAGVYCGIVQAGEHITVDTLPEEQPQIATEDRDFLTTRGECPFNVHAALVRSSLLRAVGGFDETLLHGAEDWDLWLRLMRHGLGFVPSGETGAIYRQRRGSMVKRMPTEHLDRARRLLASAHEPMDPDAVRIPSLYLFDRPIGEHLGDLDVASRVLQFVGIAAVNGTEDDVDALIAELPPMPLRILGRHIDVHVKLSEGIRRALCIGPESFPGVRPGVDRLATTLLHRVDQAQKARVRRAVPAEAPDLGVVLVPESAGQVEPLLALAEAMDRHATVVLVDRVSGDEGVAAKLAALGVPAQSASALELSGATYSAVAAAKPYGAGVAALVKAAEAMDAAAVSIDAVAVDHLDDNALHDGSTMDIQTAAQALRAAPGTATVALRSPLFEATPPNGLAAMEEYPDLPFDGARLGTLRNAFAGQRCVIIGNGPSLNDLDLSLIGDTPFFAVNGIFHAADRLPCPPTFFVVEDSSVAKENTDQIRDFEAQRKFFPSLYRSMFGEAAETYYFRMNRGFYATESPHYCVPRFSTDAAQRVFCGQSVTIINLQLAYHFGFSEVALIGMDFSYTIPSDADRAGDVITSRSDDPNHFHPDYFGKGKTWKDPKLERVLANYQLAKSVFEADGRRIVNATAGGALEIFDRVDFAELMRS